jgi:hypothetical protein
LLRALGALPHLALLDGLLRLVGLLGALPHLAARLDGLLCLVALLGALLRLLTRLPALLHRGALLRALLSLLALCTWLTGLARRSARLGFAGAALHRRAALRLWSAGGVLGKRRVHARQQG